MKSWRSRFSPPKGIHCFSTKMLMEIDPTAYYPFQSPEGDSLFFYEACLHTAHNFDASFSPPKGIHCFSTIVVALAAWYMLKEFQSPEGDSLFLYLSKLRKITICSILALAGECFSPPKGIHCFSTRLPEVWADCGQVQVSVPRRGFIVFLPWRKRPRPSIRRRFSPPKGIHCFSTTGPMVVGSLWYSCQSVSVPRRGFIVFLREFAQG